MSNTIKLKRGSGSDPSASDLSVGEVALRTDNASLFTKKDDGTVAEIGAAAGVSDGDKGDITVSNSGATFTINNNSITNAKVLGNIAGTKISPDFGSQNVQTGGNITSPVLVAQGASGSGDGIILLNSGGGQNNDFSRIRQVISDDSFVIENKATGSYVSRFTIASNGEVNIPNKLNCDGGLDTDGDVQFNTGTTNSNILFDASEGTLKFTDNNKAAFGSSDDLEIFHDGSHSNLDNSTGYLKLRSNLFAVQNNAGDHTYISVETNEQGVNLFYDNSKKLETTSLGTKIIGDLFLDNPDNSGKDIQFDSSANKMKFDDDVSANFGSGDDLTIVHTGTRSEITNSTGDFIIQASQNNKLMLRAQTGESHLIGYHNAQVELYHNGSKKLETTSGGALVTGDLFLNDNGKLSLGTGGDLKIYHSSNNNIIDCTNSNPLFIQSDLLVFNREDGTETYIKCTKDSSVELYHNNSKKLETTSNGIQMLGHIDLDDQNKLLIGDGNDLQIYHDGSHSYIEDVGTGNLRLNSDTGILFNSNTFTVNNAANSHNMITAFNGGAVELYHNNSKKFETTSSGATVTGTCTATTFSGSGASLSNVNATTLDSIDSGSFLRSDIDDLANRRIVFANNSNDNEDTIATSSAGQGGLEVFNSGSGNDAFMAFHTGGDFALYFGLDADANKLAVGGWSLGANKYAIYHEGNNPTFSQLGITASSINALGITVGTANISNGAVIGTKLADDAVGTAKIADGAVNTARIADNSVTTAKIVNNSVTTAKINNDSVTADKIFNVPQNHILGRISSGTASVQTLSSSQIRSIINVADGATNVTNNNQLTNGAGYITASNVPSPANAAFAWSNFDSTNSSIRGSHNVSSMTDLGTGNFRMNFSNNASNNNYALQLTGTQTTANTAISFMASSSGPNLNSNSYSDGNFTTSSCRFIFGYGPSSVPFDSKLVCCTVHES